MHDLMCSFAGHFFSSLNDTISNGLRPFTVYLTLNKLCKFFAELFGQKKNNPYLCSIA